MDLELILVTSEVSFPALHSLVAMPTITCPKCRKKGNAMYGRAGEYQAYKFVCFDCDLDVVVAQKLESDHPGFIHMDRMYFVEAARRKLCNEFREKAVVSIEDHRPKLKLASRRSNPRLRLSHIQNREE